MGDQTAVIRDTDTSEEMQQHAVECAILAIEKYNVEREIAAVIEREFEKKHSPTWQCIVGRKFGSCMSRETKHFIFFLMCGVNIFLFKAG
ncbi:Dynein light chain 1, cytoplasmic, partial [Spheniscus humboldti]